MTRPGQIDWAAQARGGGVVGWPVQLVWVWLLLGCSGGGGGNGASPKAPTPIRDAGVAKRPDAAASAPKELRPLSASRLGGHLDGIAGTAVAGQTLYVYSKDLADLTFKRFSVTRAGSVKVTKLPKITALDHPFVLQRCDGQYRVTKAMMGQPRNKWRLLHLDLHLASLGSAPLPRSGTSEFVIPGLLCDGKIAWLIWSAAKQTRIQLYRKGQWAVTHQLAAPKGGWPAFATPRVRAVAWRGKLYLLRSSPKGLEAIVVGAGGELHRATLTTRECPDMALARVGGRFLAVWVQRTRVRSTFLDRAGKILGRWLDASFKPTGSAQVFVPKTTTSNVALHLWSNDQNRLVMGRTVRRSVRRFRGGFRHAITSHVTGYDVAAERLGPWLSLGDAPIHSGIWVGDTLHVLLVTVLWSGRFHHTPRPADLHRFRFAR